ncbi:IS66 family transposase [Acetobacter senegalensis]|uniref:IS66 family transposase n=1 Tax=Acetobacter senegalensis TaxID=446692 RepID=UPI002694C8AE
MRQDRFGASAERGRRLLDQLELELEKLETTQAEGASENAADPTVGATAPRNNRGGTPYPLICHVNGWFFLRQHTVRAVARRA